MFPLELDVTATCILNLPPPKNKTPSDFFGDPKKNGEIIFFSRNFPKHIFDFLGGEPGAPGLAKNHTLCHATVWVDNGAPPSLTWGSKQPPPSSRQTLSPPSPSPSASLHLLHPRYFLLDWAAIFKQLQVWRLATNMFFFGMFGGPAGAVHGALARSSTRTRKQTRIHARTQTHHTPHLFPLSHAHRPTPGKYHLTGPMVPGTLSALGGGGAGMRICVFVRMPTTTINTCRQGRV